MLLAGSVLRMYCVVVVVDSQHVLPILVSCNLQQESLPVLLCLPSEAYYVKTDVHAWISRTTGLICQMHHATTAGETGDKYIYFRLLHKQSSVYRAQHGMPCSACHMYVPDYIV